MNKLIRGWICRDCNTFWRDDSVHKITRRDKCPLCEDSLREDGREVVLRTVHEKEPDDDTTREVD